MRILVLGTLTTALLSLPCRAQGGDVLVQPGMGVEFVQLDFHYPPSAPLVDSGFGMLRADPVALEAATGNASGYLSVFLPLGHARTHPPRPVRRAGTWAVQNLYLQVHTSVDLPASFLASGLVFPDQPQVVSTTFGLGVPSGTPLVDLRALVLYGPTPVADLDDLFGRVGLGPGPVFPVFDQIENAQGGEEEECIPFLTDPGPPPVPPPPPDGLASVFWITLPNPANQEAALNQCGPMSWANNLQYLEDTFGVPYLFSVAEPHLPGENADNTLVGVLDGYMHRSVISRCDGSGTNRCNKGAANAPSRIPGLMDYLSVTQDVTRFEMRHQGTELVFPDDCTGTFNYGIQSLQEGPAPTWEWIRDRIAEGCALSVAFVRHGSPGAACAEEQTGGHILRVSQAGTTFGLKQIATVDDGWQDDLVNDVCTMHDGLRYDHRWWLEDLDDDGYLNVSGNTGVELELAVSLRLLPPQPPAR